MPNTALGTGALSKFKINDDSGLTIDTKVRFGSLSIYCVYGEVEV